MRPPSLMNPLATILESPKILIPVTSPEYDIPIFESTWSERRLYLAVGTNQTPSISWSSHRPLRYTFVSILPEPMAFTSLSSPNASTQWDTVNGLKEQK